MLNILVNAYAVSPSWGSEQGVGWNWIINIAKFCNVYVITESEFREQIEQAVETLPFRDNLHFTFNPVSPEIRKMCWNQGDWRFYYYYRKWQKGTLKIAEKIVSEHDIDIIHQLNMIGFREPGFLWKISGVPFVWGPVGGMETTSLLMLKSEPVKNIAFEFLKNTLNLFQIHLSPRVREAVKRSSCVIAATKATYEILSSSFKQKDIVFINETGTSCAASLESKHDFHKRGLNILWVGKFAFRKKLDIALETMALLKDENIRMSIAGEGTPAEKKHYCAMVSELGIQDKIEWLGQVPHEQISNSMGNADLLLFTSISEATSTVVPEAISNNLPVLCFNICGFGPLVKDKVGETIEISTPERAAFEFASKIRNFNVNRELLEHYSSECEKYRYELSWEWKARKCVEIYNDILGRS